jgi:hypothetical protein
MSDFRCCFIECKYKNKSLLNIFKHLKKEHNLDISGIKKGFGRSYGYLNIYNKEDKNVTRKRS